LRTYREIVPIAKDFEARLLPGLGRAGYQAVLAGISVLEVAELGIDDKWARP
jgi:hypothetical protein